MTLEYLCHEYAACFQVVVDDASVGEQFTVIPVQEGEQDLSMQVNVANGDPGIEQPVHEFETFSSVTEVTCYCDHCTFNVYGWFVFCRK